MSVFQILNTDTGKVICNWKRIIMRFIQPYEEILGLVPLFTDINKGECLKFIERCGRTCYKSEDKITDESCIDFCDKILNRRHMTVMEHSNMVIKIDIPAEDSIINNYYWLRGHGPKYCNVYMDSGDLSKIRSLYIGGNLRAWMEHIEDFNLCTIIPSVFEWLKSKFEPNSIRFVNNNKNIPEVLRRFTVRFVHDRAFSHELVRHRLCVFSQESQRYVRYDGEALFIIPFQYRKNGMVVPTPFYDAVENSYKEYQRQIKNEGQPAQFARTILPNCTKTEVVTTCDQPEWKHIEFLRAPKSAHPDMQEVMARLMPIVNEEIKIGEVR